MVPTPTAETQAQQRGSFKRFYCGLVGRVYFKFPASENVLMVEVPLPGVLSFLPEPKLLNLLQR